MKVTAIADLHGNLPAIESCDLLLIAGDICPDPVELHDGEYSSENQLRWLDNEFRAWLSKLDCMVIATPGNHDYVFDEWLYRVHELFLPWRYVQDEQVEFEGLKIWGTPWSTPFWGVFTAPDFPDLWEKFQKIPEDTDIILAHTPPTGVGDRTFGDENVGSGALASALRKVRPRLCVFGHVHEGSRTREEFGEMTLANVSVVDDELNHVYPPMTFEL